METDEVSAAISDQHLLPADNFYFPYTPLPHKACITRAGLSSRSGEPSLSDPIQFLTPGGNGHHANGRK